MTDTLVQGIGKVLRWRGEHDATVDPHSLGPTAQWHLHESPVTHSVEVRIAPDEEDGGFVVYVPSLRGIASQGETIEEALANIREAIQGALAMYAESGRQTPWAVDMPPRREGEHRRWVTVAHA